MDSPRQSWSIAALCIYGILIKPLSIIWIISFCTVRKRGDPARLPFTWMKVVYPLIAIALTFYVAAYAVYIIELTVDYSYSYYYSDNSFYTLDQIQARLFDVGWLFEYIGNIFLLLCLVDLGLSFLYVWNRDRTGHSIVRSVTAGLGVVLFALAIGRFSKLEGVRTEYYNSINDSGSNSTDFEIYFTLRKLSAAFDILLWVASLAVLALTIYVLVISRQKTQLRQNAILFLVIGILYLLRNTWELAYDATWGLKNNPYLTVPLYIQVLDPILDIWTTFVILVLVFVIGCRKRDGLWTTHQPWMANYGGGAPQVQQPQQVWPAPMNSVPQQGYAEYNHQASPVQPQMQPGWQQPVYYYPQANQGPPGVQGGAMPQPGSPMNGQHHELGIK